MNPIFRSKTISMMLAAAMLAGSAAAGAANLDRARETVRNITPAEVHGSTGPKRNPAGDRASEYRPQQRMGPIVEPPSPVNRNNPRNDPDVQRGFDRHQQQYRR